MEEWVVHSIDIVLRTILNSEVFELFDLKFRSNYHLASCWMEMNLESRLDFDYFKSEFDAADHQAMVLFI